MITKAVDPVIPSAAGEFQTVLKGLYLKQEAKTWRILIELQSSVTSQETRN